ncbi:hypothetical protein HMN09_00115800 [Mycena chlorophos]|uniref:Uncharacterized protein n=1 Tax=Mycena chlorophos TaxID=658473 RepID=A0A8H6WSS8_MYCCL|nr:hypothetical protein HMN09_00115800 [Mycena chlorophos]
MRPPIPLPLSTAQERRLRTWLDDELLKLTRGHKKRSQPDSPLQTLASYLDAAQAILCMILRIPPVDPSGSLRTAYLLRLTSDVLGAIPGYAPVVGEVEALLDWLDDLDQSWVVVLQGQVWHPDTGAGDLEETVPEGEMMNGTTTTTISTSTVTQTDRTRLRGMIIGGSAALEEWVEEGGLLHVLVGDQDDEGDEDSGGTVQDAFGELFHRTLKELGELEGVLVPVADPDGDMDVDIMMDD